MSHRKLSIPTLRRLPLYYNIVRHAADAGQSFISSSEIAYCLNVDPTQVRKDLSAIGHRGKPKIGFSSFELAEYLKSFLGFDRIRRIIIVGAGNLGVALSRYSGFTTHGMDITALFDVNPSLAGTVVEGRKIRMMDELERYVCENSIEIAILTVPAMAAQQVSDRLFAAGIKAVWNFAPVNITHPSGALVWNHDLMASFAAFIKFVEDSPESGEGHGIPLLSLL